MSGEKGLNFTADSRGKAREGLGLNSLGVYGKLSASFQKIWGRELSCDMKWSGRKIAWGMDDGKISIFK